MKQQGWLLDANVDREREALVLWIKKDGKTRGYLHYGFNPALFVNTSMLFSKEWSDEGILKTIREHHDVTDASIVRKFLSVYDEEKSRVVQVRTVLSKQRSVATDLERLPDAQVYHADIDPVQQFFIEHKIFPFGRVEYTLNGNKIMNIECLDRREDAEYETPDLEELGLEVFVRSKSLFPTMDEPIEYIELYHQEKVIRIQEDCEKETLLALQRTVDKMDPDVIVTKGGDERLFQYLTLRAKLYDLQLKFSRDDSVLNVEYKEPNSFWQYNQIIYRAGNQVMFNGRIHIDRSESLYYSPSGMEGVIEGCRLACVRPQRVSRMSIGSANAAVQYYTAHDMDILIPPVKRNPEFLKTLNDLANIDRGGLIFQPKPDIYENIIEVDFASMYPTLMVTRNISPETICTRTNCEHDYRYCLDVPGLDFRLCGRRRGLISKSLEVVVKKRNEFKQLIMKGMDTKTYALKQNTLKGILVSCFGYLGFKNAKFGRVEAHTAVCALAREILLKTQEIGEDMGLETVHGIVDSLWLRPMNSRINYKQLQDFCEKVSEEVDIPMSLKGIYKWLVIPSSRLHPSIAPLNRYYGVYLNGGVKVRGIETRRRDTCLYVGDCQKAMIEVFAHANNRQEFIELVPKVYEKCQEYISSLMEGDVDVRDLVLQSRLTREPAEYRATSRAAIVAKQLVKTGRELHAGQKVRYVMVDSDSPNPLRRVKALELLSETTIYDPHAYAKLCIRAFENLVPAQYLSDSVLKDSKQLVLSV